ncbi:hypothetical protein D3C81_2342040 [compost metagenome]
MKCHRIEFPWDMNEDDAFLLVISILLSEEITYPVEVVTSTPSWSTTLKINEKPF